MLGNGGNMQGGDYGAIPLQTTQRLIRATTNEKPTKPQFCILHVPNVFYLLINFLVPQSNELLQEP